MFFQRRCCVHFQEGKRASGHRLLGGRKPQTAQVLPTVNKLAQGQWLRNDGPWQGRDFQSFPTSHWTQLWTRLCVFGISNLIILVDGKNSVLVPPLIHTHPQIKHQSCTCNNTLGLAETHKAKRPAILLCPPPSHCFTQVLRPVYRDSPGSLHARPMGEGGGGGLGWGGVFPN